MENLKGYLYEILLMIAIGAGIYLGINMHYALFLLPVPLVALYIFLQNKKSKKLDVKRLNAIIEQWGKKIDRKRNYEGIEILHNNLKQNCDEFFIDDITWKDLNMDAVIKRIDRTMSFGGIQYLYHMLRKPLFMQSQIHERMKDIKYLQENKRISCECQYALDRLGVKYEEGVNQYLYEDLSFKARPAWTLKLLAYSVFTIPALVLFVPKLAIFLFIALMIINSVVYNIVKSEITEGVQTFKYVDRLIKSTRSILDANVKLSIIEIDKLQETLMSLGKLNKRLASINYNREKADNGIIKSEIEMIVEYLNMIILKDAIAFYEAVDFLHKYREDIRLLHLTMSKLDAYLSIASYRGSIPYYVEPSINTNEKDISLTCDNAYHPLLEDAVPNSIYLKTKGALITGSNASGKSTFLRTVGANVVLAQTICTVLAEEYKASMLKVMTSIGTVDSIVEGDSYFMAEAKSLKRIIVELQHEAPILCILDEIFRGTNTVERVSGAASVLKHLSNKKCCVIAATHDLELTKLMEGSYNNYHFKEEVREKDICFDYIMHDGPCTSRNAILILKQLGYPAGIFENALKMAEGL